MEKKNNNKFYILAVLGVVGTILLIVGITYAYWILTREQTGTNVINTACLNISFTGEDDITLDKAYPMQPEELEKFLSKATPYHFTIENTCDELATATINLESLNAGVEKQLNDEYIDAILYETDYHTNLNSEKKLSESMYNDENKVIQDSLHAYELYNFTLQKGETKSFNLLLYMDAGTPMEDANMNATWKGKITLSAGYKEEKFANLNGLKVPVVESGDGLYAVSHDVSEISADWNKIEYRYAGSNPDNYVSFNNEIWRIIGLVNVKNGESVEQRLKIVRTDGVKEQKDFGKFYWDTENNNWTTSKLKDMLNGIYYESGVGECYSSSVPNECNFNSDNSLPKGLDEPSKNMIDKDVIWNLGGWDSNRITINQIYEKERGIITGNDDEFSTEWSDETDVSNKFNGIGLMYPSDYGYAVGGNNRASCLTNTLFNYDSNSCNNNIWLKPTSGHLWTITPYTYSTEYALYIYSSGQVNFDYVSDADNVWPTLYLKTSVKITPNSKPEQEYGTVDNPFQLSQSDM